MNAVSNSVLHMPYCVSLPRRRPFFVVLWPTLLSTRPVPLHTLHVVILSIMEELAYFVAAAITRCAFYGVDYFGFVLFLQCRLAPGGLAGLVGIGAGLARRITLHGAVAVCSIGGTRILACFCVLSDLCCLCM